MTPDIFTQILLGITLAVVGFLVSKILTISKQTEDLYTWHNISDEEGVKIWYVRRSLEEAIGKLADNIAEQTKLMSKWQQESHDMMRDLQRERMKN